VCYLQYLPFPSEEFAKGLSLPSDTPYNKFARGLPIQNFYKSKIGKLNSTTYYVVKDKRLSRTIKQLNHNGTIVTDPDTVITRAQDWFGKTA
jgi:hypothetical protein